MRTSHALLGGNVATLLALAGCIQLPETAQPPPPGAVDDVVAAWEADETLPALAPCGETLRGFQVAIVDADDFHEYCNLICLPEHLRKDVCWQTGRTCTWTREREEVVAIIHESVPERRRGSALRHELLHALHSCARVNPVSGIQDWDVGHEDTRLWCDGGVWQRSGGDEMC